ncbi:MAG TPA: Fe-S protein assembly chaperone HscA [Blastocatellia bacterium]|nr:Fe-S protein assembly chaperone HscA [Blastocatellia bacterium]
MPVIELSMSGRPKSGRVVGIDLGTTNSLVAYMSGDGPAVIRDEAADELVPSVVYYDEGQKRLLVGEQARARLVTEPRKAIYSVKRFMGRGAADVQEDLRSVPFRIAQGSEQVIRFQMGDRVFTPPEISAFILRELKERASRFFGEEVTQAVITVPAYFNDAQRQATKDAGHLAGLDVLRIVNEPTAASLAYGIDKRRDGLVAVYDLGGGTFDISILKLNEGIFEVLSTNGDTHLGGDDIDNRLIALVVEEVESRVGKKVADEPALFQAVRKAVIGAKHELSESESSIIAIDLGTDFGEEYRRSITRDEFERLIADLVERTLAPCKQALKDADLDPEQVDEVVMVGGSTRIPYVRRRVEGLFKRKAHTELNPDEVVALGAAIQADILAGGSRDLLLLDVTPLSLGIETMGGVVAKIINRNSTIPASASEMFTTWVDNQTGIDIHVVQGEREMVEDCRSLARFTLKGIPPQPAGLPRIEVRYLIDANGILTVSARDVRSGQEQSIEVKPSYGLSDEQIERMLMESMEFAEEDIRKRQLIEARNEAETVMRAAERALAEQAEKLVGESERAAIRGALDELRRAVAGEDHRLIREKIKELDAASHHLAELMMDNALVAAIKDRKASEVAEG